MKTIINMIDEAVRFYNIKSYAFKRKDFNSYCNRIIVEFESLVKGRSLLPKNYLDELSGIPCDRIDITGVTYDLPKQKRVIGLSYTQMINYLRHYAKTLKHMTKPYLIKNN